MRRGRPKGRSILPLRPCSQVFSHTRIRPWQILIYIPTAMGTVYPGYFGKGLPIYKASNTHRDIYLDTRTIPLYHQDARFALRFPSCEVYLVFLAFFYFFYKNEQNENKTKMKKIKYLPQENQWNIFRYISSPVADLVKERTLTLPGFRRILIREWVDEGKEHKIYYYIETEHRGYYRVVAGDWEGNGFYLNIVRHITSFSRSIFDFKI